MENSRHIVQVYVGSISQQYEALSIEVHKNTLTQEIVNCIVERLLLPSASNYYLAEVVHNGIGEECKERQLGVHETPVGLQRLWPQYNKSLVEVETEQHEYRFCLREKLDQSSAEPSPYESQFIRDYFKRFLYCQPKDKEYQDLCLLSNLTEELLLQNLKQRFENGHIYTYVGSILISVNPFKYYPIYNPKYVKLYQNHRVGELPPHIFAVADAAYHTMVKQRKNQCIVISGESGSGKTESTLFLLHHLTMLSQKGSHGSGVEQTILSSGPVLEAFGNAKTKHNNNSSRFGKFIQVSYKENGLVQGACVQKYLLEKSRICSQALNERSYHVFYYLLAGASPQERTQLGLLRPKDYCYLNQSKCYIIEGCDEQFEFLRLKQSMEMVGFSPVKQQRLFSVLSAVLLLGNVEFHQSRGAYQHDESVAVRNIDVVASIAALLGVSMSTLTAALTAKRAPVQGEVLVIQYRKPEAVVARDALAKCLYGALFDWIVLQLNYSLLSLKEHTADKSANSIGVLDIFGFEDFANQNRFEQFCINYANERLQRYFNQHVFEYEQEEYQREGIAWTHIEFQNNVDCLVLIEGKPTGLLCILDDQCSFPGATNETFLEKINSVHKDNDHYEVPLKRESAFIIHHYAGPVKYQVNGIREKNLDLMRPELITVLKHSRYCVVRELAGADPVAVFRWAILRAFCRAVQAFRANRVAALARREQEKRKGSTSRDRPLPKATFDQARVNAATENHPLKTRSRSSRTGSGAYSRFRSAGAGSSNASSSRNKNLQTVKALAQRTLGGRAGGRKLPHTVTGQFQLSLLSLMDTLNTANPYFIRCIKSNANKEPNVFDDMLVMRQLRYTGMLETVRIRQAGYNVRMTYDEFVHHYRILLPKGLKSTQNDVEALLSDPSLQLSPTEYQEGLTRVFMRESERQKLDAHLHQTILSRILLIQRWYRAVHQRRLFLAIRAAALRIQCCVRRWLAEQQRLRLLLMHRAATCIQRHWRGYQQRRVYQAVRRAVLGLQCAFRGSVARARYRQLVLAIKQRGPSNLEEDSSVSLSTLASNLSLGSDGTPPRTATLVITSTTTPKTTERTAVTTVAAIAGATFVKETDKVKVADGVLLTELISISSGNLIATPVSPSSKEPPSDTALLHPGGVPASQASYQYPHRPPLRTTDSLSSSSSGSRKSSITMDVDSVMERQMGSDGMSLREHQHRTDHSRFLQEGAPRAASSGLSFSASSEQYRATRTSLGDVELDQNRTSILSEPVRIEQRQSSTNASCGVTSKADGSDISSRRDSSKFEEVELRKDPARRYNSSGDIGLHDEHGPEPTSADLDAEGLLSKKPPPRRRSAVSFDATIQNPSVGGRRRSEQWRGSRRLSGQQWLKQPQDANNGSSPSLVSDARVCPSAAAGDASGTGKSKSFRHRPYPKLAPSQRGSEDADFAAASQESLSSGGDAAETVPSFSSSTAASRPPPPLQSSSAPVSEVEPDTEVTTLLHPQQQQGTVGTQSYADGALKGRPQLVQGEAGAGVHASKHKYNIKKTFKSIMGKTRIDGSVSTFTYSSYITDDDNSSLSCGGGDSSAPHTPTLEPAHPHLCPLTSSAVPETSVSEDAPPPDALPPSELHHVLVDGPHSLKQSQLKKGDSCAACAKTFTSNFFLKTGYKCLVCRLVFHQRCVEHSRRIPCGTSSRDPSHPSPLLAPLSVLHPNPSPQRLRHRHSISSVSVATTASTTSTRKGGGGGMGGGGTKVDQENKWNLTRTSQFEDRSVDVITDVYQLQALQDFITDKLFNLETQHVPCAPVPLLQGAVPSGGEADTKLRDNRERKDSQVDQLFMASLRSFKEELVSLYSVLTRSEQQLATCIKYKDLTNTFERIMTTVSRMQLGGTTTFPVTMGVNAFRGFIDEFIQGGAGSASSKKSRRRSNYRRKKKEKKEVTHGSHKFSHILVNIPTLCEVCNSFLWLSAKGLSCRSCKLTCHEKCLAKVETLCGLSSGKALVVSGSTPKSNKNSSASSGAAEGLLGSSGRVFGVPLERQQLVDNVPLVVDRLIYHIEMGGLFTEGLYRKSAATSKVREVKALIEEDANQVQYSEMPVHVLTTLLKAFLRELPEPLLTFDAYDPLLHASLLSDAEEQISAAFRIIESLPILNFTLVERLFFHLARVAHQEPHNRMNCNSLAIVFSPCIVRGTRSLPVTESLNDVSKQTQVIERVISRRLFDYRSTLAQIDTIDSETVSAGARLTSIRQSNHQMLSGQRDGGPSIKLDPRLALQEFKLKEKITNLQEERERLTQGLPDLLTEGSSEEDMLDMSSSRAGSEEDVGSISSMSSVGATRVTRPHDNRSDVDSKLGSVRDSLEREEDPYHTSSRHFGMSKEDFYSGKGQSLKETREHRQQKQRQMQAPPRRRHVFGRQLSADTVLPVGATAGRPSKTDPGGGVGGEHLRVVLSKQVSAGLRKRRRLYRVRAAGTYQFTSGEDDVDEPCKRLRRAAPVALLRQEEAGGGCGEEEDDDDTVMV